jgi:hypothetical protein
MNIIGKKIKSSFLLIYNKNLIYLLRRLMSRSVSLKPPPSYLPPLEDAEQITMDIESYRQVMKDVMVVKTVLHQLDRLLKHSDGANMTVSFIRMKFKKIRTWVFVGFNDGFIS